MNTTDTGHTGTNLLVWVVTTIATFLTKEWYLVFMVVFGLVHAYVAFQRNNREKELHKVRIEALKGADSL